VDRKSIWIPFYFVVCPFGHYHLSGSAPSLPNLESKSRAFSSAINTRNPLVLKNHQNLKYNGFKRFLLRKFREDSLRQFSKRLKPANNDTLIRAGFYVPWDNASLQHLIQFGNRLNTIFPEWLFIDSTHLGVEMRIDSSALKYMRAYKLKILPIFSNFNSRKADFDPKLIHRIFSNNRVENNIIAQLIEILKKYQFAEINIDFEELGGNKDAFVRFEKHSVRTPEKKTPPDNRCSCNKRRLTTSGT